MRKVLLISLFILIVASKKVMPWFCLERCGSSPSDIQQQLEVIRKYSSLLTGVSFEIFNLGPNSQLVRNNLTDVSKQLSDMGLETYAMISSYPYPKEFIDWMRQLFANPDSFIADCIDQGLKFGFTGYNVDFEPTVNGTPDDAKSYAQFLNTFAGKLHEYNMTLSVDVATWNPIWDWPMISSTNIDKVMVMSTYSGNPETWIEYFYKAINDIPNSKLGIGLQTVNPNNDKPLTDDELYFRFDYIIPYRIEEIDIWVIPLGDNWWPFISRFVIS